MIKWKRENTEICAPSIRLQNQHNSVLLPKATTWSFPPWLRHTTTKIYKEELLQSNYTEGDFLFSMMFKKSQEFWRQMAPSSKFLSLLYGLNLIKTIYFLRAEKYISNVQLLKCFDATIFSKLLIIIYRLWKIIFNMFPINYN